MLDQIYSLAVKIDRHFKKKKKLPFPVISVGNISSGGRAKTPFVNYLVNRLIEEDYLPVILTRGYKRKSTQTVILDQSNWRDIKVDDVGDEAIELFVRSQPTIVVGKKRYKNAIQYLSQQNEQNNFVFVLDDGFQHWGLARDVDIVIYNDHDLRDKLLPMGRLREKTSALSRADLKLHLGHDIKKESHFKYFGEIPNEACILTTRVVGENYKKFIRKNFKTAHWLELADHASYFQIVQTLQDKKDHCSNLVVGLKEAVKLLPMSTLDEFFHDGFKKVEINGRSWNLYLVDLTLRMKQESKIWEKIKGKL